MLVAGLSVQVSLHPARFASCSVAARSGVEIGHSHIPVTYSWSAPELVGDAYVGKITATVATPSIILPQFQWPSMTQQERNMTERVSAALLTHEKGHIAIALSGIADQHLPVYVTVSEEQSYSAMARDRVRDLSNELQAASANYDRLTAHGINQEHSPLPAYRGPSTRLVCP